MVSTERHFGLAYLTFKPAHYSNYIVIQGVPKYSMYTRYIHLLQEFVIPYRPKLFRGDEFYFQKDGAPPHLIIMWKLIWTKICQTDGLEEEVQLNTHLDHQI